MIPQTDPRASYVAHKDEIDRAIAIVLDRGRYVLGPEVEAFEREFAAYLGVEHVIGVGNGTDALRLALESAGVRAGDTVATVSHTAVATVAAIELAGAIPVLVDIDPATFTIDCSRLEEVLRTRRVGAIVPVHLYGHPANMPAIVELARRYRTMVIEDCAQSHGASIDASAGARKTGILRRCRRIQFLSHQEPGRAGRRRRHRHQ